MKLAIDGGTPVRTSKLNYGRQWIDEDDIQAVEAVLRSDFLTMGPNIEAFEKSVANFLVLSMGWQSIRELLRCMWRLSALESSPAMKSLQPP